MVWSDPNGLYTMQNCILYPIIVTIMQRNQLDPVSDNITAMYRVYNQSSLSTTSALAWTAINNCTSAYCEWSSESRRNCSVNQSAFPSYQLTEDLVFTIVCTLSLSHDYSFTMLISFIYSADRRYLRWSGCYT